MVIRINTFLLTYFLVALGNDEPIVVITNIHYMESAFSARGKTIS